MTTERNDYDPTAEGEASYRRWKESLRSAAEYRQVYEDEAAKSELWLQLVEARQAVGLTQAELAKRLGVTQSQVARIEKRGYDAYTLTTLRRYVQALGEGFALEVKVHRPKEHVAPPEPARA